MSEHVAVPKPQDAKSTRTQEGIAVGVVGRVDDVLTAVELDDHSCFKANEIANIATYRPLPAEFEAIQLAATKALPQNPFGVSGVVA